MTIQKIFSGSPEAALFFFNGWGMDEHAIKHLSPLQGHDGYMFYRYNEPYALPNKLKGYTSVIVVAWSLGVWVATNLLSHNFLPVTRSLALNGTERPLDDAYGIPPAIFKNTLANWNASNRDKFMRRIFGGRQSDDAMAGYWPQISTSEQHEELKSLYNNVKNQTPPAFSWDHAIIGKEDLVFSARNQMNYWKNYCSYTLRPLPHFPFAVYTSWQELLNEHKQP